MGAGVMSLITALCLVAAACRKNAAGGLAPFSTFVMCRSVSAVLSGLPNAGSPHRSSRTDSQRPRSPWSVKAMHSNMELNPDLSQGGAGWRCSRSPSAVTRARARASSAMATSWPLSRGLLGSPRASLSRLRTWRSSIARVTALSSSAMMTCSPASASASIGGLAAPVGPGLRSTPAMTSRIARQMPARSVRRRPMRRCPRARGREACARAGPARGGRRCVNSAPIVAVTASPFSDTSYYYVFRG